MANRQFNSVDGYTVGNADNLISIVTSDGAITATNLSANGNVAFSGSNVSLGNVTSVRITGGTSGQYLRTDGTGNLSWASVTTGSTSNISNGTSNVSIPGANGSITLSVGGVANVAVISTTGAVINGNITATGTLTGTLGTASQPNITSVGTLTSLSVSGNVSVGNITGVFANGNSNVNIPSANGNINLSVAGNANVLAITGTGVNVAGSLNAVNLVSTGNANLATLSVASNAVYANSTRLVLGPGVGLQANGNLGASGQVLTSNGNSTFWGNKGAAITNTAPTIANQGDMWWDTDIGTLFVYYNDGISTQWVEAVPQLLIETTPDVYQLNGNLVVTNNLTVQGTLFETSDITLKKNVETFPNALSTVEKLRGVEFDWKSTDNHSAGVIAQELEAVLPYLVSNSDGIKSVNYTAIIGVLIEAIKELSDKVDKSCQ